LQATVTPAGYTNTIRACELTAMSGRTLMATVEARRHRRDTVRQLGAAS
jgi:hypothetical protein